MMYILFIFYALLCINNINYIIHRGECMKINDLQFITLALSLQKVYPCLLAHIFPDCSLGIEMQEHAECVPGYYMEYDYTYTKSFVVRKEEDILYNRILATGVTERYSKVENIYTSHCSIIYPIEFDLSSLESFSGNAELNYFTTKASISFVLICNILRGRKDLPDFDSLADLIKHDETCKQIVQEYLRGQLAESIHHSSDRTDVGEEDPCVGVGVPIAVERIRCPQI